MKIKKGDDVLVLSGKHRGQRAKVEEALPAKDLVILDGINVAKRATKQTGAMMQAGIIDKLLPISATNVALWCPQHKGPARVGYDVVDGAKVRVCRRCGVAL